MRFQFIRNAKCRKNTKCELKYNQWQLSPGIMFISLIDQWERSKKK